MRAAITIRNTRNLDANDWGGLVQETRDCISDHALRIEGTTIGAGEVSWVAEFLDVGDDLLMAKAALREIALQDGQEYAWVGITDVGALS